MVFYFTEFSSLFLYYFGFNFPFSFSCYVRNKSLILNRCSFLIKALKVVNFYHMNILFGIHRFALVLSILFGLKCFLVFLINFYSKDK